MIKKFVAIVMLSVALTACGQQRGPRIYNDRFMIEDVNQCVKKITDLKTNRSRFETKDGDVTEWYPVDTTWDEASEEFRSDNITTWDDADITTWDDI